ncbi:hypothetical protein CPB86DRAFT_183800 [Serendipita vermifera]|nr:hypothetical protein CPB86DRAFT_183800 [Serendipita vermifera]
METHELCVICGLTPDGGPTRLFDTKEKCLDNLIKNLQDMNLDLDMGEQELRQEIENILDLFEWAGDGYRELLQETSLDAPYFPFPDQLWDGWKAIVIGTFDESGQHLSTTFYDANGFLNYRPSRGYDVITQLVDQHSVLGGYFDMVDMDNYISASSYMSNGNLFCLRAPYFYLQAWLHRETLPPRQIAFPSEPDMSFEGELYEIINTRKEARRGGILCAINYGGIEHTYDGQYQDYLECDDTRPTRLGQLLKMGKRGHDLIPGFLYDFNTWQTCPTDRYDFEV